MNQKVVTQTSLDKPRADELREMMVELKKSLF